MNTYTKSMKGLGLLREAIILFSLHNRSADVQVDFLLDQMTKSERRMSAVGGVPLIDKDVLVIGPGQSMREMLYLGLKNRAVGIDLDVIADSFSMRAYLQMLRKNGAMRTLKTATRKALRLDARFEKALERRIGISNMLRPTVLQMDAAQMTFPDNSFDCIYSFSVFEHLPAPEKVLAEVKRVLRPGGICYISLHLYTSLGGCHDLSVFANGYEPPHWPHLRPALKETVQPNAFLNEVRVPEWKAIFYRQMPGVNIEYDSIDQEKLDEMLAVIAALRREGELTDYTDEELININLIGTWRKPIGMETVTFKAHGSTILDDAQPVSAIPHTVNTPFAR